jgi:hypothetical protein
MGSKSSINDYNGYCVKDEERKWSVILKKKSA